MIQSYFICSNIFQNTVSSNVALQNKVTQKIQKFGTQNTPNHFKNAIALVPKMKRNETSNSESHKNTHCH
jgi:hypothetical protein